jgi:hypothetical protein
MNVYHWSRTMEHWLASVRWAKRYTIVRREAHGSIAFFQAIEELVFPIIKSLGDRIVKILEGASISSIDKITIDKVTNIIMVNAPTHVESTRTLSAVP